MQDNFISGKGNPAKSADFVGRGAATERADFGGNAAEEAERSLWRRGQNITPEGLYLMDGIEGLRSLPRHSVDMLLTDPPYGTTRNYWDVPLGQHRTRKPAARSKGSALSSSILN